MINPFKPFTTPEYFFRPRQIFVRLSRAFARPPPESARVTLPWGDPLTIRPAEVIGASIWFYGVFDLIVAEAICRLLEPGELALDIGANIGQMTTLMRRRAGPAGKVIAFEPHPEGFAELAANVPAGATDPQLAPAELHQVALSDAVGEAFLDAGEQWGVNRGVAKVVTETAAPASRRWKIKRTTLDQLLPGAAKVGLCKIDVEGHELKVFQGAARLLRERRVRDIIFEDLGTFPSPVHRLLLDHGFSLFSLHARFWRPRLALASAQAAFSTTRDGANYVATLDPERAAERFRPAGWWSLRRVVSPASQ